MAQACQSGEADPELLRDLELRIEAGRIKVAELAERGRQTAARLPPVEVVQARLQELEQRR